MEANDSISILIGSLNIQIHVYVNTCIFDEACSLMPAQALCGAPCAGIAARTAQATHQQGRDFA
jgi:hypothetical protein